MSNNSNQPNNRLSTHTATAHYGELQDGNGERLAAKTVQTDGMLNDSQERVTIVASPRHEPQMFSSAIDGHGVHAAHGPNRIAEKPSHSEEDEIGAPPPTPRTRFGWALLLLILGAGTLAGLFFLGWEPRVRQDSALAKEVAQRKDALPRVSVDHPRQSPRISTTLLPGDVQALEETTVYPRTSGYLKRWLVDIGDQVKAGDLLAEIDTPEVDEELNQAQAALGQLQARQLSAEVNSRLADITLKRFRTLLETRAISDQEYDEHKAAADVAVSAVVGAKADVKAGESNVQRLKDLQDFAKVYAPYEGTITARNIESGYLVSSGNTAAQSLFRLAKTDPVRVFVHVPQMYAVGVKPGLTADILVRELPDRKFVGTVTRTARAIDPATRTLLTEIRVPNPDHALLTGSYVQVKMNIEREAPPLLVPASALVVNSTGTTVALVDGSQQVHFRPVTVEGDFGADVGISQGLSTNDLVVTNPGERLADGTRVDLGKSIPKTDSVSGEVKK